MALFESQNSGPSRKRRPFFFAPPAAPLLSACALLAACGPADNDPGPGGVTVGEARALDEAAEMLDERKARLAAEQESAQGETARDQQQPDR